MNRTILAVCLLAGLAVPVLPLRAADIPEETKEQRDARMGWWREARFGMFIHWGAYAVPADGEWYMTTHKVPVAEYEKYAGQLNPVKFDADQWATVAHDAGMKYLVITAKHHDGFCMFKTATTKYNIVDASPWHQDPLAALSQACKKHGVRFCCYYSIMDWHEQAPAKPDAVHPVYNPTSFASPEKKTEYISYMKAQLKELIEQYHPGLLWFDGGWMKGWTAEEGKDLVAFLRALDPNLIINDRTNGGGDYGTPEQKIPASGNGKDWETCMTVNGNWGFSANDHNFKSTEVLLHNLIDIASKGGNYLLNVGPTPEGIIPVEEVDRLKEMGQWLGANSESIYGSKAGPFKRPLAWGRCTQKPGKLFLQVFDWKAGGELALPLQSKVTACHLLTDAGRKFDVTTTDDQTVVHLTGDAPDKICSVIELDIEGTPAASNSAAAESADGAITLEVSEAEFTGDGPNIETKAGKDNIGYWLNPAVAAKWAFKVTHPGKFVVSAPVAAVSDSKMTVEVGGQELSVAVPSTGSYDKFQPVEFGAVTLDKAQCYELIVKPVAEKWSPINLQAVTLKPADK